jgi:hypothetical protein
MPRTDLITKQFGLLTVVGPTDKRQSTNQGIIYECLCKCGNTTYVNEFNLRNNHTKSCGCLKHAPNTRRVNITGQQFGMLTAMRFEGLNRHHQTLWLFHCDCGNDYIGRAARVKAGEVSSCGCQEGSTTHGLSRTPAYDAHKSMIHRCYNTKTRNYHRYGGRGINICERWLSVENFITDMGQPSAGLTIERIDNEGGYWCGQCDECINNKRSRNCKWDTQQNQARNKSSNHPITARGKTMLLIQWTAETGLPTSTILNRLKRGWSEERAVTEPSKSLRSKI